MKAFQDEFFSNLDESVTRPTPSAQAAGWWDGHTDNSVKRREVEPKRAEEQNVELGRVERRHHVGREALEWRERNKDMVSQMSQTVRAKSGRPATHGCLLWIIWEALWSRHHCADPKGLTQIPAEKRIVMGPESCCQPRMRHLQQVTRPGCNAMEQQNPRTLKTLKICANNWSCYSRPNTCWMTVPQAHPTQSRLVFPPAMRCLPAQQSPLCLTFELPLSELRPPLELARTCSATVFLSSLGASGTRKDSQRCAVSAWVA